MSDVPISALPAAGALTGAEIVPGVQGATTVGMTSGAIAALAAAAPVTSVNSHVGVVVLTATDVGAIPGSNNLGYLDIPQNIQNVDYQLILTDQGKHLYHTVAGAHTYTIPANATVAFQKGTAITIALGGASGNITVALAGGVTLRQAGTTNTGARTLAANALATLLKVDTDEWMISGVGVT